MTTPTITHSAITHLERRRIEAGVLIPLVRAFRQAFGAEAADAVVRTVIAELARGDGTAWADRFGTGLDGIERVAELWASGEAMTVEDQQRTDTELQFAVKRCRYAELYQDLGLADLGAVVHCSRDAAMLEAMDPALELTRTRTLMQGGDCCDFRFRRKP